MMKRCNNNKMPTVHPVDCNTNINTDSKRNTGRRSTSGCEGCLARAFRHPATWKAVGAAVVLLVVTTIVCTMFFFRPSTCSPNCRQCVVLHKFDAFGIKLMAEPHCVAYQHEQPPGVERSQKHGRFFCGYGTARGCVPQPTPTLSVHTREACLGSWPQGLDPTQHLGVMQWSSHTGECQPLLCNLEDGGDRQFVLQDDKTGSAGERREGRLHRPEVWVDALHETCVQVSYPTYVVGLSDRLDDVEVENARLHANGAALELRTAELEKRVAAMGGHVSSLAQVAQANARAQAQAQAQAQAAAAAASAKEQRSPGASAELWLTIAAVLLFRRVRGLGSNGNGNGNGNAR